MFWVILLFSLIAIVVAVVRQARMRPKPNLWDGLVGLSVPCAGQTGELLMDCSGNGNHGRLVGNPKWVTTEYGHALDFGGHQVLQWNRALKPEEIENLHKCLRKGDLTLGGLFKQRPNGVMKP